MSGKEGGDFEFERVLRSLALSPAEARRMDAIREKIRAQVETALKPLENDAFDISVLQKLPRREQEW